MTFGKRSPSLKADPPYRPAATMIAKAFDTVLVEARAELAEHQQHVADCQLRLQQILALRVAIDTALNSEAAR